jgi:uncharacterized membrane protein
MIALKTLHIVSAVLWLGNFVVTGIWALRSWRESRDVRVFATREILFTDLVFTLAFGSAVVISGLLLAKNEGIDVLHAMWTAAALGIVIVCGIVWCAVLLPLELRLHAAARSGAASYRGLFVAWNVVGWLLTLALFSVIYLMVAKPA